MNRIMYMTMMTEITRKTMDENSCCISCAFMGKKEYQWRQPGTGSYLGDLIYRYINDKELYYDFIHYLCKKKDFYTYDEIFTRGCINISEFQQLAEEFFEPRLSGAADVKKA